MIGRRQGSAVRSLAPICLLLAVSLGCLGTLGCNSQGDPITVVVHLRDDAQPSDVEDVQSMLDSDERVSRCSYVSENVSPTEEAARAAREPTSGAHGDPWYKGWLEVVLPTGSRDAVLASIESHPSFDRTVAASSNGGWWQVR